MLLQTDRGVLTTIPGGARTWCDLLSGTWKTDPYVVLIVVPKAAKTFIKTNREGTLAFTVMEVNGREWGLQIQKPDVPKLGEQAYTFAKAGIQMARPDYVGRLSELPQRYLLNEGDYPICYLRDDMSGSVFNVRADVKPRSSLERRKEFWS